MSTALALSGVTVRFGSVVANRNVSLAVEAGSIHALVGENGAGKTTLMRAAFGLVPMESGELFIKGERVATPSPQEAIGRGLGMVHQHFLLVDTLTVAENIVLGAEPRRRLLLDRRRAEREVATLAAGHGLAVDPGRRVGDLSVGEQQRVEILKALYRGAQVLILDEPTAVLTPPEVEELFTVLRRLVAAGGTVLLVTHKLDEVMAISSCVSVLRKGEVAGHFATAESSPAQIARAMVGRELAGPPAHAPRPVGETLLAIHELRTPSGTGLGQPLEGVSLEVRAGEIVGIAGVEGNGQSALIEAVTGLAPARAGTIRLCGVDVTHGSPATRRRLGLGLVPEDRHRAGLLLDLSLADNLLLGRERDYAWAGLASIDRGRLLADSRELLARYDVRPADPAMPARLLSGGNQQKVVLARELLRRPRLLIAAHPTRGVDVGAIELIHREIEALRAVGRGVLLISAEIEEVLALSDRIFVLLRGRMVAELSRAEATRALLGQLMTGATDERRRGVS